MGGPENAAETNAGWAEAVKKATDGENAPEAEETAGEERSGVAAMRGATEPEVELARGAGRAPEPRGREADSTAAPKRGT